MITSGLMLARVAPAMAILNKRALTAVPVVLGQRGLNTTVANWNVTDQNIHPGYAKLKKQYERFQVDDGVPVHFKAGTRDYIMYAATWLICGAGLIGSFHFFYKSAFPPKNQ